MYSYRKLLIRAYSVLDNTASTTRIKAYYLLSRFEEKIDVRSSFTYMSLDVIIVISLVISL